MKYIVLLDGHEIGRIEKEEDVLDLLDVLGIDCDNDIRIIEA